MNMEVDLDINHYDLESLVALFKIPIHFKVEDLKKAKKTVLAMHPDKSKLDKKYFLFFSKAYKILYEIHQFKIKSTSRNVQEYNQLKYNDIQDDKEYDKQNIIDKLSQSNHFITTFNEIFDKHYAQKENNTISYKLVWNSDSSRYFYYNFFKADGLDAINNCIYMITAK